MKQSISKLETRKLVRTLFFAAGVITFVTVYPSPSSAAPGTTGLFRISNLFDGGSGNQGLVVIPATPATVDNSSGCAVGDNALAGKVSGTVFSGATGQAIAFLRTSYVSNPQVVASVGDVTGDGDPEFVIGAKGDPLGDPAPGRIYAFEYDQFSKPFWEPIRFFLDH